MRSTHHAVEQGVCDGRACTEWRYAHVRRTYLGVCSSVFSRDNKHTPVLRQHPDVIHANQLGAINSEIDLASHPTHDHFVDVISDGELEATILPTCEHLMRQPFWLLNARI